MNGLRAIVSARKVTYLLAALALLFGLQMMGMSVAANAGTSPSRTSVAQVHQARPDTAPNPDDDFYSYYENCEPNNCKFTLSCEAGNTQSPIWLYNGWQLEYVINGCNVRVWLAEYSNGTGYTLCLSPYSGQVPIYRSYEDIGVSTNGSSC
jgi:hypothetical protein